MRQGDPWGNSGQLPIKIVPVDGSAVSDGAEHDIAHAEFIAFAFCANGRPMHPCRESPEWSFPARRITLRTEGTGAMPCSSMTRTAAITLRL